MKNTINCNFAGNTGLHRIHPVSKYYWMIYNNDNPDYKLPCCRECIDFINPEIHTALSAEKVYF